MKFKTHTGGLKEFGYAKPKRDPEFEERIDAAFEKARKRKLRNKRILILITVVIILGGYFLLR